MDPEERIINSIESLEAQLEMAREFLRLKKWANLDLVVQNIARTVNRLAESAVAATVEHPSMRRTSAAPVAY